MPVQDCKTFVLFFVALVTQHSKKKKKKKKIAVFDFFFFFFFFFVNDFGYCVTLYFTGATVAALFSFDTTPVTLSAGQLPKDFAL